VIFGSVVMFNILQEPDRELNLWPMSEKSHDSISIIGLSKQYSVSEPISIQIKVKGSSLNCGDLYITINSSGKSDVITQGGFFEQCFSSNGKLLPINDKFSHTIDIPGSYEIDAVMVLKESSISTQGVFTVK
jgi:hypothetical protein